jgi:hypothetical protein
VPERTLCHDDWMRLPDLIRNDLMDLKWIEPEPDGRSLVAVIVYLDDLAATERRAG